MRLASLTRRTAAASILLGAFSSAAAQKFALPPEAPDTEEGRARKARSEARLRAESVPILASLPVLAPVSATRFRSVEETTERALCLAYVAALAETDDPELIGHFFGDFPASARFTPRERAFVQGATRSEQDRINFSWRYEAYAVLAWALGAWDDLGRPDHQVDVAALMGRLRTAGIESFRASARLRSGAEILDFTDLVYRYDWAAVDARSNGRPAPAGLSEDVIVEWHKALNWLTCYMDLPWDDVRTDT